MNYCSDYTYRNGAVERILMGNGFWQDSVYYVQIKDYQGNVLTVQTANLKEQGTSISYLYELGRLTGIHYPEHPENNVYYPYGGLINASDTQLQPYKYSSNELDRENGLDLYDF